MKGRSLVIGATAKHAEVATSAIVGEAIPALAELAGQIGDPAVRHKGTIGGSLANNDPTRGLPGRRSGARRHHRHQQAQAEGRRIFPGPVHDRAGERRDHHQGDVPAAEEGGLYQVPQQASRYALVGVFVAKRPSDVRVAITGAGSDGVFRAEAFEEALKKRFSHKVLDGISVSADGLNSDLHGSAEYRAHLIGVLTRRAVEAATAK